MPRDWKNPLIDDTEFQARKNPKKANEVTEDDLDDAIPLMVPKRKRGPNKQEEKIEKVKKVKSAPKHSKKLLKMKVRPPKLRVQLLTSHQHSKIQ